MSLYFYISILIIILLVLLGLVLYFRSRMNYIYSRFKRFSDTLYSSISGINGTQRDLNKGNENRKIAYCDAEDIKELIDSFSLEFKRNSELLDSLLNNVKQGILLIDGNKKILRINESLLDLFSMDPRQIIERKTIQVFNNGKLEKLIDKVLKRRTQVKEDIVFYSDEDIYLNIEAFPIYPGNTGSTLIKDFKKINILIIIDNTTQEVEFSKLRSQFAANVSHEMRTPLTSIRGYIETVLDSDLKDKKIEKDYLEKSLKEVEKLNFLIKDVLDLSKIEYSRNILFGEKNDLIAIIKDIVKSLNFLANNNKVRIDLRYSKEHIFYNTDEELFAQLVRNIIENSIFYSGKGSNLNIDIEEKEDHILLIFSDNGMGIKKEELSFIFQRFYRGRPGTSAKRIGSGIGLSIVKHTVDLHGGNIKVESMPGIETKFTIKFPVHHKGKK